MSIHDHQLELLSPARTAEIGIEAINHGADAIYIGGPSFGARDKAGNAIADIERLCAHAHRHGARVFITINTILRDDELEEARRMVWDVWHAGADALIVQDMGLPLLDLPPIQLHASTQTDIRTPEKARFLQDAGFSQMVLARELTLQQIRAIHAGLGDGAHRATLEFFIHGALCVAYSGNCYISHAVTGRSANRGSCSQECRQPWTVTDQAGRIVAHEKHVLSLKDNDQSANLEALVDAGIRSFKIEGRYKDMATVKNVTAHYRQLLDQLLERRPEFSASSDGRCRYTFAPDPERAFNRGGTDYFVNGRQQDIGAFDTPKHAGIAIGHVSKINSDSFDVELSSAELVLNNGDALTWWDRQGELQGVPVNVTRPLGGRLWRVTPNLAQGLTLSSLKDLRRDTEISRNRDMAWERLLDKKSAERLIAVDLTLRETPTGFALDISDGRHQSSVELQHPHEAAKDAVRAETTVREHLGKLGGTLFAARNITLTWSQPWFIPASSLNALRREAVSALESARAAAWSRLPRARPVEPPAPYPEDTLSYLANVYNGKAAEFYARHGVKIIDAAYESHEELGEASLMITKHCVRFSLSLCPKQAKGVTGVQGTVRAEPMTITQGKEKFTLRFDCKPCEMHVVGKIKKSVIHQADREAREIPLKFYRTRPEAIAHD